MKLYTFYFIFILFYKYADCVYLIPKGVKTQIGLSYVLIAKQDNVTANECYIYDGKSSYTIDLNEEGKQPILKTISHDVKTSESDLISSLGNGICGFKMDKVSLNTAERWSLTIIDKAGKNYTASANIGIRENPPITNKQQIQIGGSFSINCIGNRLHNTYCNLFNPLGELVKVGDESCFYTTEISKVSDLGTWKCMLSYDSSMEETQIDFIVSKIEMDQVLTWKNETKTHVHLGCSVTRPTEIAKICIMVRPDQKNIKLVPGLATERYTSIDTNLDDRSYSVCSMQIKKPLLDNEYGFWRCEQHLRFDDPTPIGGFINITKDGKLHSEPVIPKSIFVHVNKTLKASCRVQYSTSYCYMKGPDGLIYPIEDSRFTTLGLCSFKKASVLLTDNGTWYCGFGKETGETDDVFSFQVYIPEVVPIHSESQSIVVRTGSDAILKCTTRGLGDYPLQYCRFLSPDGKMYQIGKHNIQRITYNGNGLDNGECGIKIHDIQESDAGTWSCITRIGAGFKDEEVYTNINLSINDDLSQASVLGIVFGVGIIALGVGVIAIWKIRSRRAATSANVIFDRQNPNRTSDSSQSHVILEPRNLDTNEIYNNSNL